MKIIKCPVCGKTELEEDGDVCDVCNWFHDIFQEKYPDEVTVYTIGNVSKELCGGPHVKHTGELGHFKIVKEEASSQGVRRIKAILE